LPHAYDLRVKGMASAATAVAAVAVIVSAVLMSRVDSLYAAKVAANPSPYISSGEAEEMAFAPAAGLTWALLMAVLTGLAAWQVRRRVRRGRLGRLGVAGFAAALLVIGVPTLVFAARGSTYRDEWDLFGWWYVPFLAVTGAIYTACLFGWVIRPGRA
jgi:hypothetical protein